MKPRLAVWLALPLAGCGSMALLHDAYLAPISPAGRVHPAVRGESVGPTEGKIRTTARGEALLRPVPLEMLDRLGSLEFGKRFVTSTFLRGSFVVSEQIVVGAAPRESQLSALSEGLDERAVLVALGAPDLWIKRPGGSLMFYRADLEDRLTYRIGFPPIITRFLPIPGLANLRYTDVTRELERYRTLLFFDGAGRLSSVVRREGESGESG